MANAVIEAIARSNLTVHFAVLVMEFLTAITTICTQVLLDAGVQKLVLGFYCLVFAGVVLGIASLLFERGKTVAITLDLILSVLFFGALICAIQFLAYVGISNTSATFVAALQPTSSIFTAFFAVVFGVETLKLWRYDGQVKLTGIFICMSGAVLMSLYQGPCVIGNHCATAEVSPAPTVQVAKTDLQFKTGAFCIILGSIITAVMGVFAAKMVNKRPATISLLAFTFTTAGGVSGVAALLTLEKSAWLIPAKLVPIALLISLCSLTLIPVLALWCIKRLGPTTVSCYHPANTIISAVLSVVMLGTSIFLGSVIGAVLIVVGLLLVSWAQEECLRLSAKECLSSGDDSDLRVILLSPEGEEEDQCGLEAPKYQEEV